MESFAQFLYVSFVEAAFLGKTWDTMLSEPKIGTRSFWRRSWASRTKDFHRISIWDGVMVFSICFNQGQQDRSILLLIIRWLDLLVGLSRADKYSSCWRADVIGVGELTSSAYFFLCNHDFCHSFPS